MFQCIWSCVTFWSTDDSLDYINITFSTGWHSTFSPRGNIVDRSGTEMRCFSRGGNLSCHLVKNVRKRKRSDSVLWQKPLHQQKCQKGKVTTQTTPQKSSIKQRLRTDLGRSVGVTSATQLVWLTGLRAHLPTNRNSRLIKRTYSLY